MPVNFDNFTKTATINGTDRFVGYFNASLGGERSWQFSDLKNSIFGGTQAANTISLWTNSTQRVIIDASGNVGIGQPTPSLPLEVSGKSKFSTNSSNVLQIVGTGVGYADASNGVATIYSENTSGSGGNVLKVGSAFAPNGLIVKDTGNVGIGIASPQAKLDLGSGTSGTNGIGWSDGTANNNYINIWGAYSSSALTLGYGYKGSSSVSNGFVSSASASYARSAISLDQGLITFYTNAASIVPVGTAITPTARLTIDSSGNVTIGSLGSGIIKSTSGLLSVATAGTDYQAAITGAASTVTSSNLDLSRALVSNGTGKIAASTITATELGYLTGVTSAIQTQLGNKEATITGAATTINSSNLTASRAVISNASGKIAVSTVTDTELGYLTGVTSAIQTQLNNLGGGTSSSRIAVGTTAERPSPGAAGMIRYNTTNGNPEWYDLANTTWRPFSQGVPYSIDYLIVAGGGAGGSNSGGYVGGGGGAGGYISGSSTMIPNTTNSIVIGAGGPRPNAGNYSTTASNGTNSSAFSLIAIGGGAGGSQAEAGYSGGSGGGASHSNTSGGSRTVGQGNAGSGANGSYQSGGGGGASAAGTISAGGAGSNWLSLGTFYAGGGGGSYYNTASTVTGGAGGGGNGGTNVAPNGNNGTANRGGGGGGCWGYSSPYLGGNGGSGIVIIRYLGDQKGSGGTITSAGGYTYHTFTTSGTYTA